MRSMKGRDFEREVDELVRGALADMDDEITPEDMLDFVVGHMGKLDTDQLETAKRMIERRLG